MRQSAGGRFPRACRDGPDGPASGLGVLLLAGQVVTTGTCVVPLPVIEGDEVSADFGVLGGLRFAQRGGLPHATQGRERIGKSGRWPHVQSTRIWSPYGHHRPKFYPTEISATLRSSVLSKL